MRAFISARSLVWLVLVASCAASACVPASEPAEPAGAIGFVTVPTAASQGEPFATDDGWTVRIETLVLQLHVSASTSSSGQGGGRYSGDYADYRFAANQRVELYGRGLNVGPATATANLGGGYVGDSYQDYGSEDRIEILGVPPEASARFRGLAEVNEVGGTPYYGPSVLMVARGQKAGRTLTVDFTMAASNYTGGGGERSTAGVVHEDALTVAPLAVMGEALFVDEARGQLLFEPFADADQDRDGVTTGAELGATTTLALGPIRKPLGLVDRLLQRADRLLVAR